MVTTSPEAAALNLLTAVGQHNYSGDMISEFQQLSDKISQLSTLAESLRRENAELRQLATDLTAEREELTRRMNEASQRVEALLESIPAVEPAAEAA